jgi:hypothetical protein
VGIELQDFRITGREHQFLIYKAPAQWYDVADIDWMNCATFIPLAATPGWTPHRPVIYSVIYIMNYIMNYSPCTMKSLDESGYFVLPQWVMVGMQPAQHTQLLEMSVDVWGLTASIASANSILDSSFSICEHASP